MIYSDVNSGLKIIGSVNTVSLELAYIIQKVISEGILDYDELLEVNEKALTAKEPLMHEDKKISRQITNLAELEDAMDSIIDTLDDLKKELDDEGDSDREL